MAQVLALKPKGPKAYKLSDMTKRLMSFPKCMSVEVINNTVRLGSNRMEVNYINYK